MSSGTRQAIAIACLGLLSLGARGQDAGAGTDNERPGQSAQVPAGETEEVIVRGQSRAKLRFEIERAELAVMERFNELNSKDEYDIHCRREMLTGSNIPRRVCRANFWREAEATAGRETAIAFQGGAAFDAKQFQSEALYKHELMSDEMRQLVAQDSKLRRAVSHLGELQLQAGGAVAREAARKLDTSAHVVTSAEAALPYDAALRADVLIQREPWSHELTQQVFTIAELDGEIGRIEVECSEHSTHLDYQPGAEWNLPADWAPCTVQVDARPGTTFALYEFE